MFSEDINLFLSHRNINTLFKIFNEEANKSSLNNSKTKYTLFHKKFPIKFLGVILDANISWGNIFPQSKLR